MISHDQLFFTVLYQLPALLLGLVIERLRVWPQLRFFLLLPGTLAHELLHYLVALLTCGKPRGFSVWPRRTPDGWVLGAIGVLNFRWYNGLAICLAPLWGIVLMVLLTPRYSDWHWSMRDLYQWLICAPLWIMCWPSRADWRAGINSASSVLWGLACLALALALWFNRIILWQYYEKYLG